MDASEGGGRLKQMDVRFAVSLNLEYEYYDTGVNCFLFFQWTVNCMYSVQRLMCIPVNLLMENCIDYTACTCCVCTQFTVSDETMYSVHYTVHIQCTLYYT